MNFPTLFSIALQDTSNARVSFFGDRFNQIVEKYWRKNYIQLAKISDNRKS